MTDTLYEHDEADDRDDNRSQCCPACGRAKPRRYTHRMDASKCKMLREIAGMNARGVEWVKVQRDGHLIRDPKREIQGDDVHALRLTWFGLCERKGRRTGLYRVTDKGWRFLAGDANVPERIVCQGGRVLQAAPTTMGIREAIGIVYDRDYWTAYAKGVVDAA